MDPTRPPDYSAKNSDPRPRGSSLTVAAISLVLAQPLASSLYLADIARLARTCRALTGASGRALVSRVSVIPHARAVGGAVELEDAEGVRLWSASAVDSFARFIEKWGVGGEGGEPSKANMEEDEGGNCEDATGEGGGEHTPPQSADAAPPLRPRQLALHLHQLTSSTSLLKILHLCASTLTHLRITYAEHLLAHDKRIYDALASLSHLTSLVIHSIGPRGCVFLKDLKAPLEDVEVGFDGDWVLSVLSASLDKPAGSNALIPVLLNGDSAGLPTPTPSPGGDAAVLPDPISLLANSMGTLRTLRASNAIIATVADTLRYPRVKALALRLAGVPTVTPLVHAFPALAELYVYTPFDGVAPVLPSRPDPGSADERLRAPLPSIHATRAANRRSQLYSSFSPLARVRGFVPGLYALGLTCMVRHVEVSELAPPGEGAEYPEAWAVREVLADAKPTSVTLGLGRGWWAEGRTTVLEREREREKGREREERKEEGLASGARQKRRERETARDALTSIFGGSTADDEVWAGVTDLVLRVEEPGNWKHVTRDILAMLLPLTSTLTTFVLHWDRTSVPFDRIPHDDGYDDPDGDIPMPMSSDSHPRSAASLSRTEAFARRTGEQNPALRYALIKILHDDPARPLSATNPKANPWSVRMASPPTPTPSPLCESRFFRIERSQGWLCLDTLPAGVAEKVMAAEGLSFTDRVRY